MPATIAQFPTMIRAVAFVVGDNRHAFWVKDAARHHTKADIEAVREEDFAMLLRLDREEISSTLIDWAFDTDKCAGFNVDTHMHLGTVIAHYTDDQQPVRFVAIKL